MASQTFELNYNAQQHFPDAHYWSYAEARNYGYLLLKIASADGKVADREMFWLTKIFAEQMGIPADVVQDWQQFSYEQAEVNDLAKKIPRQRASRLLYDAIRMCSADGLYALKERKMVEQVCALLEVSPETLKGLELLVESEALHEKQRSLLLK